MPLVEITCGRPSPGHDGLVLLAEEVARTLDISTDSVRVVWRKASTDDFLNVVGADAPVVTIFHKPRPAKEIERLLLTVVDHLSSALNCAREAVFVVALPLQPGHLHTRNGVWNKS